MSVHPPLSQTRMGAVLLITLVGPGGGFSLIRGPSIAPPAAGFNRLYAGAGARLAGYPKSFKSLQQLFRKGPYLIIPGVSPPRGGG